MSDLQEIESELNQTLSQLQAMEAQIRSDANVLGVNATMVQDATGRYLMHPIIIAKAGVLSALAPIVIKRLEREARNSFWRGLREAVPEQETGDGLG